MRYDFFPDREADMVSWGRNMLNQLRDRPGHYGVPAEDVERFAILQERFETDYARATNPATRTMGITAAKNTSRRAMEKMARSIATRFRWATDVSDIDRITLRLNVPRRRARFISPPTEPIAVRIRQLGIRSVTLSLRSGKTNGSRAKPDAAQMAELFYAVGDVAPSNPKQWTYLLATPRTDLTVMFPTDLSAGARVWIVGRWITRAARVGPWGQMVTARAGILTGESGPRLDAVCHGVNFSVAA